LDEQGGGVVRVVYPVIVIGPPRSGTSAVARTLHNHLGVSMDGRPKKKDFRQSDGWFEDLRLVEANVLFFNKNISLAAWTRRFKRFIRARIKESGGVWGFKDPRMIRILRYALTFFNGCLIVRCHMEKEKCTKSQVATLNWTQSYANDRYDADERILSEQLKGIPHVCIDMTNYIPDKQLISILENIQIAA